MANEKLDLIDRGSLMAQFDDSFEDFVMKRIIERQPKVDAVPVVHGEWLDGYAVDISGKKVYDSIDCSVCNDIFKIESHDREYWKNRFKNCPFCGAKMDGGNEDGK